jgi:hypothetical protein
VVKLEEFFFGVSSGSTKKALEKLAPRKFNIMINYASKVRAVPKNVNKLFVDSGGFSFVYKLNDYPDSPKDYLRFVYRVGADYFANRDYPAHPQVLKKLGITVRESQMRTIENQIRIMELLEDYYPKLKPRFVAVLQGWELEDYLWMLDYMREHGLLTPLIGLGSMVRNDGTPRKYIVAIRKELPRKYRLHGFGIKFSLLKHKEVWDALYSADSLAYHFHVRKNWVKDIPLQKQLEEAIKNWILQFESLKVRHSRQLCLDLP